MKNKLYLSIIFILTVFNLYSQSNQLFSYSEKENITTYLKPLTQLDSTQVQYLNSYKYINIMYGNGDCAFCIKKLKEAQNFYNQFDSEFVKTFFIVDIKDTLMFNFHREQLNITVPILKDFNDFFSKKDKSIEVNDMILLNSDGLIILKGDFLNDTNLSIRYEDYILSKD
ncbi:hypothetical protein [Draconibacterium halophilum]|uniref:Uncharacterized protein n=1 Tax=Draconibacterium halophilum TaxID=2706887 RepID=A0A6C0RAT0_9BACT|nr:hypothetical protein [Draconibacterium halophilum]QIA06563.1 hypothetical protein G0Q07_01930 [Draconibacterium halophilum]